MLQKLKKFFKFRSKPVLDPLLDQARDFLDHWLDGSDSYKQDTSRALLFAADGMARECGYDTLLEALNSPDTSAIVASRARSISQLTASDIDQPMVLYSNTYAAIAVICQHRLGGYAGDYDAMTVAEMATKLYSAAHKG